MVIKFNSSPSQVSLKASRGVATSLILLQLARCIEASLIIYAALKPLNKPHPQTGSLISNLIPQNTTNIGAAAETIPGIFEKATLADEKTRKSFWNICIKPILHSV